MKKKKLKNYLKIGMLLFGISIFLVNCQKDDDFKTVERNKVLQESRYRISKINLDEIKKKGHLTKEIIKTKSVKDKNTADNLKIYTSIYDFQIDTDFVTYIESTDGLYHSYTFPIINKVETDSLKNLLISLQPNGTYAAFIVNYATTAQEKEDLKNGIEINLTDKVSYSPIDDNLFITEILNDKGLNTTISYKETSCPRVILSCCTCGTPDHPFGIIAQGPGIIGDFCPCYGNCYYDGDCEGESGNSTNTDSSTDSSTDNSTTNTDNSTNQNGGSSTNEDVTAITLCTDCHEFDENHQKNCEELHKFSTKLEAQDEFNFLDDYDQLTAIKEKGYLIKANPNPPYFTTDYVESTGNDCEEISMPLNNALIYSIMHTHPTGCGNGTQPMFWQGDLYSLYSMTQNYNPDIIPSIPFDNSMFTVYMTVENYHYAIKIKDISKLNELGNIFGDLSKRKKFIRRFGRAFDNASDNTTPSQSQLTIAFLKFINDTYDLGVSLYRTSHNDVNYDPNLPPEDQISRWKQLILDENNNIDYKDC